MSNTIGNTNDLDFSRVEALQGLLRSLGHTNDEATTGTPLDTDQVHRLSEKIKEILGDVEDRSQTPGALPSKLLNEEGLPIIDISELVNDDSQPITPFPVPYQELIPSSLLSPEEKGRRQRERDRILDLLEEEERLQLLQEEWDANEERKEAVKKRKELAKAELEQLKTARDLQKKMGQALVQPAKGVGESEHKDNVHSNLQNTASAGKKSVTFADTPAVDEKEQQPDWGDVIPGRLRAQRRIPLLPTADEDKYPMKTRVVERHPAGTPASPSHGDADSDDESASFESPYCLRNKSSGEENTSSSSNNGLSDDEPLEEGFDYDIAQHHREIALEYHKKRNAIGARAAEAMATLNDDCGQQGTTKEQLPLSRFRADHMAAAYDKSHDPVSMSIGQTLIPASRQQSLRSSVRLGKLENDQLVGEESGESGSEDEIVRGVIQTLQTGSIHNVGPDFGSSSLSGIAPPRHSDTVGSPTVVAPGTMPSRFRLARGGSIADTSTGDIAQSQSAVSSVVERKDPRLFPINKPPPSSATEASEPPFPVIVDPPSFPAMSRASPRDPGRPVSKFMAERKK